MLVPAGTESCISLAQQYSPATQKVLSMETGTVCPAGRACECPEPRRTLECGHLLRQY